MLILTVTALPILTNYRVNNKKYHRNCPKCNIDLYYKHKGDYNSAKRRNVSCISCCQTKYKKINKTCLYSKCNTTFVVSENNSKKYCSHECSVISNKIPTVTIKCIGAGCGQNIIVRNDSKQQFCSRKCSNSSRINHINKICKNANCSIEFKDKLSSKKQYCSYECSNNIGHNKERKDKSVIVSRECKNPNCDTVTKVGENSTRQYCSLKCKGNGLTGNIHTPITKQKMRVSTIEYIQDAKLNGGQLAPRYNISSIPILEQKSKELGITDLQHAENGGEYHIKELGYWVDGYSKEKNIVFEYDEKHHFKNGKLKDKDIQRQKEIEKHLGCIFIRIADIDQ